MAINGTIENEIQLVDYIHRIHECNRYLFLAKVHIAGNESVIPKIDGDPISYIETIVNVDNINTKVPIKIKLSHKEIQQLRVIFNRIKNNDWHSLEKNNIEKAQEILLRLLDNVRVAERVMELKKRNEELENKQKELDDQIAIKQTKLKKLKT